MKMKCLQKKIVFVKFYENVVILQRWVNGVAEFPVSQLYSLSEQKGTNVYTSVKKNTLGTFAWLIACYVAPEQYIT